MDLHSVETYLRPTALQEIDWQPGWTWLAGGTWIFNGPQPQIKTLVDLQPLNWSELEVTPDGLAIGAMCIQNKLLKFSFPDSWTATEALKDAVRELASFKVSHAATVGGNLCLALPASTFAPVMVALGASYEIWRSPGESYQVEAIDFQTAPQQTILQSGDVLRRIWIPQAHLQEWRTSFKRIALSTAGYALSIVVAAYNSATQKVRWGIGASVQAPRLVECDRPPTAEEIAEILDAQIPSTDYLEDERATAAYRRHITQVLMQRTLTEVTTQIKTERRY